jgi:hypothetical protein
LRARHRGHSVEDGLASSTAVDVLAERIQLPIASDDHAEGNGIEVAREDAHALEASEISMGLAFHGSGSKLSSVAVSGFCPGSVRELEGRR